MALKNEIDFLGKKKIAGIISSSIILISILFIVFQGGLNYNIEFNGGYLIQAGFKNNVSIGELRELFQTKEMHGVQLQEFSSQGKDEYKSEILIKFETMDEDISYLESKVQSILDAKYKNNYIVRQKSSIGPKVGGELKTSAIKAIFFALLGILLYITFKFQFRYGIAAIVALFHDVIITVGIYSMLGLVMDLEISLSVVAALMTIVGYSLNDTLVVFVRIRENIEKYDSFNFQKIVNISINETLTRTLLTSLTTLFVVSVLFIFGGDVIKDLSTALLIGVVVGTYSSIFVASPFVILWESIRNKKRNLKKA